LNGGGKGEAFSNITNVGPIIRSIANFMPRIVVSFKQFHDQSLPAAHTAYIKEEKVIVIHHGGKEYIFFTYLDL
jgi:hypothetical protein